MKKVIVLSVAIISLVFVSCKGNDDKKVDGETPANSTASSKDDKTPKGNFDYKSLGNKEYLTRLYDDVLSKMDGNKAKTDRIDLLVARPSKEGMIKSNRPDYLTATVDYQDPANKNNVFQQRFHSNTGWDKGESREIKVIIGDAENFNLSDEVFDITPVTADILNKVLADALAKLKDEKYKDQYIKSVNISKDGIDVTVTGQLVLNDQFKSESYRATLAGAAK